MSQTQKRSTRRRREQRRLGRTSMDLDVGAFNKTRYDTTWQELKQLLDAIEKTEGLPGVLRALHRQQLDQGFIQDDLSAVIRWRLRHPQNPDAAFIVQFNPRRANRHAGAGRSVPPPGTTAINDNCFLDRENIRWQQRGIEIGYDLSVGATPYVVWMNPFPLMPTHVTIAKRGHEPQSWIGPTREESRARIESILRDFLDITGRLPGFIGFYNGEGAGASIPGHFHFQFFERPQGREPFPLEHAAAAAYHGRPVVIRRNLYPITTLYFRGDRNSIVAKATNWVDGWTEVYRNDPSISANVIASAEGDGSREFHLFFVPRNRHYSHSPGMVGLIGGLEVLGELVFATEAERLSLDTGQFDYLAAARSLGAVEAPGVDEFLSLAALVV